MRYVKRGLFAVCTFLMLLCCSVSAKNNVTDIDILVKVNLDGSAYITQNWTGNFDEGTECYIPINTSDIEISNFEVSDEKYKYTNIGDWDINADFGEKSAKCGINQTSDGVELCFGITEYGEKHYSIGYNVSGFIKSYSDFDGMNFMFINPGMSTFPTNGKVTIYLEDYTLLNFDNAAIWAFGYDGDIQFTDGKIEARTASALEGDNSMIVMLQLNKGILTPAVTVDGSFEDVKNAAFENSDYGYDDYEAEPIDYIIGFAVLFGIFTIIVWFIMIIRRRKKEIKNFCKDVGYFRDVPNNGNIEMSHYLAQNFDVSGDESLIIGALLLSMINKGFLEPQVGEKVGMFGKITQTVSLKLVAEPDSVIEKRLYNILSAAAGDDGILQEKELETYAYANPKTVNGIIDDAKANGEAAFTAAGGFVNRPGRRIRDLSETGKNELAEVVGLKKYLDEFSLIAERSINETLIWQDYMVYATLFGIADKVMKQLEKVYPERIPEFESYNRNVVVAYTYYHSMHSAAERAVQQQRTSGMGGSASISGGGGFSGGGYGGGTR